MTSRSLLPAAIGLAVAAAPVGIAAVTDRAPAPTSGTLRAALNGQPTMAMAIRDAGRDRLEGEHLRLASDYDRLTGRHTAGRAAAQSLRMSPARLRSANRRLRADVRELDMPIPPILHRIAECESHNNPHSIGGGGAFRGALQFTQGTWAGVGGKGDPAAAPMEEQLRRGAILLRRSGSAPWPVCGA